MRLYFVAVDTDAFQQSFHEECRKFTHKCHVRHWCHVFICANSYNCLCDICRFQAISYVALSDWYRHMDSHSVCLPCDGLVCDSKGLGFSSCINSQLIDVYYFLIQASLRLRAILPPSFSHAISKDLAKGIFSCSWFPIVVAFTQLLHQSKVCFLWKFCYCWIWNKLWLSYVRCVVNVLIAEFLFPNPIKLKMIRAASALQIS